MSNNAKARKRRRRLAIRCVVAPLLLAFVAAAVAYRHYTSSEVITDIARRQIAQLTAAEVNIGSADFSLQGPITLHDVSLRVPGRNGKIGELFDDDHIHIKYDPWALFEGTFKAQSIVFERPTLHLTELMDDPTAEGRDRTNIAMLLQLMSLDKRPKPEVPALPDLFIGDAAVRIGTMDNGKYTLLQTLDLSGSLTASARREDVYQFMLHKTRSTTEANEVLTGSVNMRSGALRGSLANVHSDSRLVWLLPRKVRTWWQSLNPTGAVPITFGLHPESDANFFAELVLQDVGLTLPFLRGVDSRITDVNGTISVLGQVVSIVDLRGKIEDFDYQINGQIRGFDADAPFFVSAQIDGMLPEKPRYLFALPDEVQHQFYRFLPSGEISGLMTVERQAGREALAYSGNVKIRSGKLTYSRNPYPLQNVNAQIAFDNDRIHVRKLTGAGPNGGRVHISGQIAPPGEGAKVDLDITARQMPYDDVLLGAMEPNERRMIGNLLHKPTYQRLRGEGLIQTAADRKQRQARLRQLQATLDATTDEAQRAALREKIDELTRLAQAPVFELGGLVNLDVDAKRPPGKDRQFNSTITVHLAGLNILLKDWQYPMTLRRGKLIIQRGLVVIEDLVGEGLHGGVFEVSGRTIVHAEPDVPNEPLLNVAVKKLPIDQLLLAALPPSQRQWLRELRLDALADVYGRVYFDKQRQDTEFDFTLQLREGTARPYRGGYPLQGLGGKLRLTRRGVQLGGITAYNTQGESLDPDQDSQIELTGTVRWAEDDQLVDLKLQGRRLRFEEPVIDIVSADASMTDGVRRLKRAHSPSGRYDALLHYRKVGEQDGEYELTIEPKQVTLSVRDHELALKDMSGKLHVSSAAIALENLSATTGDGDIENVKGSIRLGDNGFVDLSFNASAKTIGDDTRAMLPRAVLDTVDRLQLTGGFTCAVTKYRHDPGGDDEQLTTFKGEITLKDSSAVIGLPISDIHATLDVEAQQRRDESWPRLNIGIEGESARVSGRLVSPITLKLATTKDPGVVTVDELAAKCYGGVVMGKGWFKLGEDAKYHMNMTLQDVAFEPFIKPEDDEKWLERHRDAGAQRTTTGMLSANLTMEGAVDDPSSRRGRGAMRVRDARLYNAPLAVAVLQIFNLNLPVDSSFDEMESDYLIVGDTVQFDKLEIEAQNIRVIGEGKMGFDDQKLDLWMYSRRKKTARVLEGVGEIINVFRDELLSIHVTGTLSEPKTQVRTLSGIKGSLEEILAGRKRGERPEDQADENN